MNFRTLRSRHASLLTRSVSPSKHSVSQFSVSPSRYSVQRRSVYADSFYEPEGVTDQLAVLYGSLRDSTFTVSPSKQRPGSSLYSYESAQFIRDRQRKHFQALKHSIDACDLRQIQSVSSPPAFEIAPEVAARTSRTPSLPGRYPRSAVTNRPPKVYVDTKPPQVRQTYARSEAARSPLSPTKVLRPY